MTTTKEVTVLPPGVELPDGVVLSFGPDRRCPCRDCTAAFQALNAGDLKVPEAGDFGGAF